MGMANPDVGEPIDKLADVYPEGTRFYLVGARVVTARSEEFGPGEMAILKVRGHERELGVWGSYIIAQVKSASAEDFNKWYVVNRRVIEGFGRNRAVKVLDPAPAEVPSGPGDALDV